MTSIFYHPYCKPFIRHPFESIKWFFISLKWAYQRVKKGYCDKDLIFGVENWFLEMLPEVIDEIKEKYYGTPGIIHVETIASFGINPEEYWDTFNVELREMYSKKIDAEAKKRWHDILSRISFLLREAVEWQCSKQNPYKEKYDKIELDDPEYKEIRKRFNEEDRKLEEYRDQCKREAVALLLKWSYHLEI